MADSVGLRIISLSLNDTNGGSFLIGLAKNTSNLLEASNDINNLLSQEFTIGLQTEKPYFEFTQRVNDHKEKLVEFFSSIEQSGQKIWDTALPQKGM